MADKMENLLAQVIIESTRVTQTDMALERMTQNLVRENLHNQTNLARFQQTRANNLENDIDSLKRNIINTNTEKRHLQEQLQIAMDHYVEANGNTHAWIELLNKPFHVIAESHEGFNENYKIMMGKFSKIVLENMVQNKTIDHMAEKLDYTSLDVDIIKHNYEGEILLSKEKEDDTFEDKLVHSFTPELSTENSKKYDALKVRVAKSGKSYK